MPFIKKIALFFNYIKYKYNKKCLNLYYNIRLKSTKCRHLKDFGVQ